MNSDEARIWQRAGELFDEQVAAKWSLAEQDAYADSVIRRAVREIAARGEMAGLAQVIRLVTAHQGYAEDLITRCTAIIDQARHEQFPGNTGWEWDEKDQWWIAKRGGISVVAKWPHDQMPPVRADRFAVTHNGEPLWPGVVRMMDNPGEAALPWHHPVFAVIPEEFWSDDWRHGVRWKVYLGKLCSPCGRTSARVCLQPRSESQAEGDEAQCVPVDPDHVRLIVLDGKLPDYH